MAASPNFKASGFIDAMIRWISELVTIYFISTFLALVGIFVLTSGEHKLYFFISTAMWLRKYDVFDLSLDHKIEVSRDFLGGATGLVNKEIKNF